MSSYRPSGRTTTPSAARRALPARRVRRLRVSLLRRRVPDRQVGAAPHGRLAAVRLPALSAHPDAPARRPRRRDRGGGGEHGRFWAMHDVLFTTSTRWTTTASRGMPRGSASIRAGRAGCFRPRLRRSRARGLPERRAQRRQRNAHLLRQRRPPRRSVGRGVADRGPPLQRGWSPAGGDRAGAGRTGARHRLHGRAPTRAPVPRAGAGRARRHARGGVLRVDGPRASSPWPGTRSVRFSVSLVVAEALFVLVMVELQRLVSSTCATTTCRSTSWWRPPS